MWILKAKNKTQQVEKERQSKLTFWACPSSFLCFLSMSIDNPEAPESKRTPLRNRKLHNNTHTHTQKHKKGERERDHFGVVVGIEWKRWFGGVWKEKHRAWKDQVAEGGQCSHHEHPCSSSLSSSFPLLPFSLLSTLLPQIEWGLYN